MPSRIEAPAVCRVHELPGEIDALAAEALAEGFRFVERLRDDWVAGSNRFDLPGEAFFVARSGRALIGVCGLNRDPYTSDVSCGRLRRLYVRGEARRRGVARALTHSVLDVARASFSVVRLRTLDPEARAFYRSLGFSVVESNPVVSHEYRVERWESRPGDQPGERTIPGDT